MIPTRKQPIELFVMCVLCENQNETIHLTQFWHQRYVAQIVQQHILYMCEFNVPIELMFMVQTGTKLYRNNKLKIN